MVEEVEVKANEGDVVVAKEDFNWNMDSRINKGEEWRVVEVNDIFVNIVRDDTRLWLGDTSFVRIFEAE